MAGGRAQGGVGHRSVASKSPLPPPPSPAPAVVVVVFAVVVVSQGREGMEVKGGRAAGWQPRRQWVVAGAGNVATSIAGAPRVPGPRARAAPWRPRVAGCGGEGWAGREEGLCVIAPLRPLSTTQADGSLTYQVGRAQGLRMD
eukprot:COSAG01_NODE_391_length_17672_cov_4.507369_6_plen_143_part_00